MRRTWVWVLVAVGAASLAVLGVSLLLPGLEELSWAAGTGSFVLAAAALALAWPRRTTSAPTPEALPVPTGTRVDNRTGDVHGTAVQAGAIHGPVTVHPPPSPATAPVPWWVEAALPAGQADAHELGAHDALPGPRGEGLPPYVVRDVDGELDRRLTTVAAAPRGGMVLVAGASTAGKTRALAQALARTLPERMLVAPPEDADLRPLPAWLRERAASAPRGWVVWLDDLDRHLAASGLTPTLVAELGKAGAVVAATIRRERLDSLRPSATDPTADAEEVGYAVLKTPPITLDRRWSRQERERASASDDARLVRAATDERFGVAEQLAAGPYLQEAWNQGPDCGYPRGYALVAAAVGLAQAGLSSPLTRDQLHTAHTLYLPTPPPLPEETDRAWDWATRQRSGMAGLLVPADHNGRWRAFDYLTLHGPLPEAVWRAALEVATDEDRLTIGATAYTAGQAGIAHTAWRSLAEDGETRAMYNLGFLLKDSGRVEEAKDWYRKVAEDGETRAMYNLGFLLAEEGRVEEAKDWYRKAAEDGDTGAMLNLGNLLKDSGRVEEAEDWYRKAAEDGETRAMNNLGVLLAEQGRVEEAEDWYRKAIESGNTGAMYNLGILLAEEGRVEEAKDWYRKAIESGNTLAMHNLGILLAEEGRVEEAKDWYRKAIESGDTGAMLNLGFLLEEEGRVEEAEDWYRKAIESGNTRAMLNLGNLLKDSGRVQEAEDWYRKAIESGETGAMLNLGVLLVEEGRIEEAEDWYRKAIESGETLAMLNLGNLLKDSGRVQEAEDWYRKAIESGDTGAMLNLGILLEEEAEVWRQRYRDAGGTE